ncbi:RNA methyltransferase [Bacteroidales bacterium OttesenSCG-928-J19]|nr:RNA methyltransferase [Bacteroidales bacterium OttesenSCG-928-J19]
MLGKNKIKGIKSLEKKKYRDETSCFLAEGNKLVNDMLPYFDCELLLAKASWLATQGDIRAKELIVAEGDEIERASLLKNPQDVLAVFRKAEHKIDLSEIEQELSLVLDGIQDPGNMGTIIRIADWFGIRNIICSPDTADCYNPKVVQATMGALTHVKLHYTPLDSFFRSIGTTPVYGTFLDGENIYQKELGGQGIIVMGNEGNGISPAIEPFINQRLYIPNYPADTPSTESLNVAVATAITCAEFRRCQSYPV